jgi:hypothetical protein
LFLDFTLQEHLSSDQLLDLAHLRICLSWLQSDAVVRKSFRMQPTTDDVAEVILFLNIHRNGPFHRPFAMTIPKSQRVLKLNVHCEPIESDVIYPTVQSRTTREGQPVIVGHHRL